MEIPSRVKKGALVVLVLVTVVALLFAVLVATGVFTQPTVQTIDKGWGDVTDESTQIETQVYVQNPNPVGIPDVISVSYTATLNDVVLTEHSASGIGLTTGNNTVELASNMDNDRISDWWVTHVNNDERSTLTIAPRVRGPGFSRSLSNRTSTIETDLLSSFGTDEPESLTLANESLLVLRDREASWGQADAQTTPLVFSTTIENVHDDSITLDGVEYNVTMNNVTLGAGRTSDGISLAPGETGTLTVDAALESAAFAEWWPTHVRNNETSQMAVEVYGIVEQNNTQTRLPIQLYQQRLSFNTDLLGPGGTSVASVPTQRETVTLPSVANTDSQWGTITDSRTDIQTTFELANLGGFSDLRSLSTLTIEQTTRINDVGVGSETHSDLPVPTDASTVDIITALNNSKVPAWWARHLNAGERSVLNTTTTARADIGVTTVGVPTPNTNTMFRTDLLSSFNTDANQPITSNNRTYLTAESTAAAWGNATTVEVPLETTSTLRNEQSVPITIERINYSVGLNDIVLANSSSTKELVIGPSDSEKLSLTMYLDNTKMDTWWVTHLRKGEQSTLAIDATATITVGGQTRTIPLEMFSKTQPISTNILE